MAYNLDLSGRVGLVTGASGGLGAQFAKTLSRAGAAVILVSPHSDFVNGVMIAAADGFGT